VKRRALVALYTAFAALSIAVNIGGQALASQAYDGAYYMPLSMVIGTAAGLACKYVLDKLFIFAHETRDARHELRTFMLYSIMGLVTTVIFWATELAFHYLFAAAYMRYVGAVLGLVVGYAIKYWLDKKLVFR
jgi:putative flippase GtrA